MGDEADRVLDTVEQDWYLHQSGQCGGGWDCPICRAMSRYEYSKEKRLRNLRRRLTKKWPKKDEKGR